ncbi:MAG: phage tail protein [Desulfovibrio sp.]
MGFWRYFRDTLRWPLLAVGGPLCVIVEGLGRMMDAVREDIFFLRDQFSPVTCEPEMVAHLGESRGIVQHPLESNKQYRTRVIKAYAWQLLGGREQGLPVIFEHYGYGGCKVESLRPEDVQRWAEFKVGIDANRVREAVLTERDYKLIRFVATDQKPARSKLAGIYTKADNPASVNAGAMLVVGTVVELAPSLPEEAQIPANVSVGGYIHGVSSIEC